MKKPFSVGGRVRVYNHVGSFKGTVTLKRFDGMLDVKPDGSQKPEESAHVKQCRRLKPRAPKAEKKVARRVWVWAREDGEVGCAFFRQPPVNNKEYTPFIELLPNHVLISREDLARAWDEVMVWQKSHDEKGGFNKICKALGFKEGE